MLWILHYIGVLSYDTPVLSYFMTMYGVVLTWNLCNTNHFFFDQRFTVLWHTKERILHGSSRFRYFCLSCSQWRPRTSSLLTPDWRLSKEKFHCLSRTLICQRYSVCWNIYMILGDLICEILHLQDQTLNIELFLGSTSCHISYTG